MTVSCCVLMTDDKLVARQSSSGPRPPGWTTLSIGDARDCPVYPAKEAVDEWIRSGDDLRFKEWSECRTTIGRLDGTLVDLRKVGFSIVTGLLTASALLGYLGVPASTTTPIVPIEIRVAGFAVILLLIAVLFSST